MSHPFGDLLTHYLHRKHGLSQAKLAEGILQSPSIITNMSQGRRLSGPQARERVVAISDWLHQQGVLEALGDANALFNAASMSPLNAQAADEAILIRKLVAQTDPQQEQAALAPPSLLRPAYTTPRHNLPTHLTPFIGRSGQISQLVEQLQTHRLLTLTGAGGVGKTRLASQVATQLLAGFADGVWFVDLAPLSDPGSVIQRILDLFRLPEQPDRSPQASLTAYLSSKAMLLILDNCEHLIAACAELAEALLHSCPQVSLLATSREALNIGGELPWRVPSLTRPQVNQRQNGSSAPTHPQLVKEDLLRFEAVALFVARAHTFQPSFALTTDNAPAVAHICSRLDGIPLALEMAAARLNLFTVEELAVRLDGAFDKRFQLLTSGARTAPQRQQTLRATLEWSYGLLTPAEQRLLARLSVFSGGWTFAAAEAVVSAEYGVWNAESITVDSAFHTPHSALDLMAQLVNKSLVIADQQAGQTRYRLLETVRQFAAEQALVDEEERRKTQMQHSRYYLALLGQQEEPQQGQQQRTAIDLIRADFENISVAWRWAAQQREFSLLAPAVHALFLYCEVRGIYREGVPLFANAEIELATAVATADTSQSPLSPLWGRVLARLGACEVWLDKHESGYHHLQQSLHYETCDQDRAFALTHLGRAALEHGELSAAKAMLQESLALSRQCGDRSGVAETLYMQNWSFPEFTDAIHNCEESLALWRAVGRPDRIAEVLNMLAWHTCCLGDYATAIAYWQEIMDLCTRLDMKLAIAYAFDSLGWVAWCQGDLVTAQNYIQDALDIYRSLGMPAGVSMCLSDLAVVWRSAGEAEQAVAVARQAVAICRDIDNQMRLILSLNYLGAALIGAGEMATARQTLLEALPLAQRDHVGFLMIALYYFAELLMLESHTANLPDLLERKALAITLLSCVRTQTATWQIYRDKAAQLQVEIEGALPAELLAKAIARGQSCTPEEMVSMLLKDEADCAEPKER